MCRTAPKGPSNRNITAPARSHDEVGCSHPNRRGGRGGGEARGRTWAVVGVEGGDGEVAVGVGDAQRRRARLQLDERGAVEVGEDAEGDEDGEAGGVDGGGGGHNAGGGEAGEVVAVGVGEEAVAPVAGGGAPRVDGEGEPPRHVYRHPPLPKLPKNYG